MDGKCEFWTCGSAATLGQGHGQWIASERATRATDVNSTAASMGEPGQTELTQSLLIRILYETLYWYVLSLQKEQNETETATPDVTLDAEMPQ